MNQVSEAYSDAAALRDGGFIFQAILNYTMMWSIVDGETKYDQIETYGWLHQVDAFPDLKFQSGSATLTYVVLSQVNLFNRKISLATEEIKKRLIPDYAKEMAGIVPSEEIEQFEFPDKTFFDRPEEEEGKSKGDLESGQKQLQQGQKQLNPGKPLLNKGQEMLGPGKILPPAVGESVQEIRQLTAAQKQAINDKYFKGASFDVVFTIDKVVLREVSTSGLDSGNPSVTLKLSTGMVDTLDGKKINSWNGFKVVVTGDGANLTIDNTGDDPISKITTLDEGNVTEQIFLTIPPSLILEFAGDKVAIDSFSSRSSQVAVRSAIDFDNLFEPENNKKRPIITPEEGEEEEPEDEETDEGDTDSDEPSKQVPRLEKP